jgi:hypothetical protein
VGEKRRGLREGEICKRGERTELGGEEQIRDRKRAESRGEEKRREKREEERRK